jgi:hypothetical protein
MSATKDAARIEQLERECLRLSDELCKAKSEASEYCHQAEDLQRLHSDTQAHLMVYIEDRLSHEFKLTAAETRAEAADAKLAAIGDAIACLPMEVDGSTVFIYPQSMRAITIDCQALAALLAGESQS